ncbi:hypothetical protein ACFQ5N_09030 [Lutibacter holmesii]|uniref:Uncharacterized protein n=1 Tax=Lutibacter holmesii TaxID=1137985 RepID=A0ABW3WR37_9FLAO
MKTQNISTKFQTFAAILLLCNCLFINAQSAPIEPINPIDEVWRKDKNIPVSGEIRTGLVYNIDETTAIKEYFFVNLPNEKFDFLFVEITSNDGRYNASLSFDIKNKPAGELKLKWSTEYYNDLKNFNSKELTILSWLANSDDSMRKHFVISNWSSFNSEEFVYIILNSEQQATINVYNPNTNTSLDFKCEQFINQPKVSFCAYCKIPIKVISKDSEVSVIQRARKSFNRYPMNLKL